MKTNMQKPVEEFIKPIDSAETFPTFSFDDFKFFIKIMSETAQHDEGAALLMIASEFKFNKFITVFKAINTIQDVRMMTNPLHQLRDFEKDKMLDCIQTFYGNWVYEQVKRHL